MDLNFIKSRLVRPKKDSTILRAAIVAALLFYACMAYITDNFVWMICLQVLRILSAIGVLWVFRAHWYPVFFQERIGKVDIMAVALAGWAAATLYHASYILLWRLLDRPDYMVISDWNGLGYFVGILAMNALISSQRNERNEISRPNLVFNILILVIGIGLGVLGTLYVPSFVKQLPIIINDIG